jgi:hypothetical protein
MLDFREILRRLILDWNQDKAGNKIDPDFADYAAAALRDQAHDQFSDGSEAQ